MRLLRKSFAFEMVGWGTTEETTTYKDLRSHPESFDSSLVLINRREESQLPSGQIHTRTLTLAESNSLLSQSTI